MKPSSMKPLNLLPLRDRASRLRCRVVGIGMCLSVAGGAALAAWVLNAQDDQRAQLNADMAAAHMQLKDLQQQHGQMQKAQSQFQQLQERWQHVRALRQRAQRLVTVQHVMARRWPVNVQVQEWRVEGPAWRLMGPTDSGDGMNQLVQVLSPHGPWQQTPTLVELSASTAITGQAEPSLHYVVQGRWHEPGLLAPSTPVQSAPPAASPPLPSAASSAASKAP